MNPTDPEAQNSSQGSFSTDTTEIDIPLLAQNHYYFKASLIVNNYYGLVLVGIGLIGNTISLLVMLQVSVRREILSIVSVTTYSFHSSLSLVN